MTGFAEVRHALWIAAPIATVRSQFADVEHHIRANVHPKLKFELLAQGPGRARYVQVVRLLGMRQRDVFERRFESDGTMVDTSVEGFNQGGSLRFGFEPQTVAGRDGTLVRIDVRVPLLPLVGGLLRPLLERQIRKEVSAAALEDKHDIEQRGYRPAQPVLRAA
jgi:hypothetical protein